MGTTEPERFDAQAASFEERAGLAPEHAAAVALAVVEIAGAGDGELVLEIGAGTGEVGIHLIERCRYLGIDRSAGMLDQFRAKLGGDGGGRATLLHADAADRWPVEDGGAAAVFGSRVLHLLDPAHVEHEARRCLRSGGVVLAGRVERDAASPRARLRKARQNVLRGHGIEPRQAEKVTASLIDRLVAGGAERVETRPVTAWTVTTSPAEILERWSELTSMGGVELDGATRAAVLDEVREWAAAELGDLATVSASTERYTLGGARFGPNLTAAAVTRRLAHSEEESSTTRS